MKGVKDARRSEFSHSTGVMREEVVERGGGGGGGGGGGDLSKLRRPILCVTSEQECGRGGGLACLCKSPTLQPPFPMASRQSKDTIASAHEGVEVSLLAPPCNRFILVRA